MQKKPQNQKYEYLTFEINDDNSNFFHQSTSISTHTINTVRSISSRVQASLDYYSQNGWRLKSMQWFNSLHAVLIFERICDEYMEYHDTLSKYLKDEEDEESSQNGV